jgi:hypothetical protein
LLHITAGIFEINDYRIRRIKIKGAKHILISNKLKRLMPSALKPCYEMRGDGTVS